MVKERYINLEVAKLLRNKGFNEPCTGYYNPEGKLNLLTYAETNSEWFKNTSAPTQQMACDWLIENYKIYINVSFVSGKGYVGAICDISDFDNAFGIVETKYYSCIESVYNEALKYVLTNLI